MTNNIFDLVEENRIDEVKKLLKEKIDINKKDKFGYTPLHIAITNKHEDMAVLLLKNGADPSIQDKDGFTSLHYAAEYNMLKVAKRIIEKNPRILHIENKYGNQPLWVALHNATLAKNAGKYDEMLKLLVSSNADINHKNKVGKSPLEMVSDPDLLKYEGYRKLYAILLNE